MDTSLERLTRTLVLTEDEEAGLDVGTPVGQGSVEHQGYLVVGRLLTPRAFRYDVLKSTLISVIRQVRGMDVRLLADHRFLIRFTHIADRDRALKGCPWAFDRNLVILASITDDESEFLEYDKSNSWGASIRVRVALDIRMPLKRFLRMRTATGELTVSFTYERLPNFCYGCGVLGHILRDCPKSVEDPDSFNGTELQYGSWLRESRAVGIPAPFSELSAPRRGIGRNYGDRNRDTDFSADLEEGAEEGAEQRMRSGMLQSEVPGERGRTWGDRGKGIFEEGDIHVHTVVEHDGSHMEVSQLAKVKPVGQMSELPSIQLTKMQPIIPPNFTSPIQSGEPGQVLNNPLNPARTINQKSLHLSSLTYRTKPSPHSQIQLSSPIHISEPDPDNPIRSSPPFSRKQNPNSTVSTLPEQLVHTNPEWNAQINGRKAVREGVSSSVSTPTSESSQSASIEGGGLVTIPIAFVAGQTGRHRRCSRRGRGRTTGLRGPLKRKGRVQGGEPAAKKLMLLPGTSKLGVAGAEGVNDYSEASGVGNSHQMADDNETAEAAEQLRRGR
ncbi:UNVERIFIED_CONTAM: hypothetical protein Sradi_5746600 [Sesamum radiatum]|uniref:CCHC-type domain-containing protein n=1 Tax=Sesamum radiatum TaxID=300843 RepID=A0AAW2L3P8_SESRA